MGYNRSGTKYKARKIRRQRDAERLAAKQSNPSCAADSAKKPENTAK
jgi:hypothetical protein